MKRLREKHHQRLVHALDIHWYPEARGAVRVTDKAFDAKTIAARVQAPRSLCDRAMWRESGSPPAGASRSDSSPGCIAARYPGTKLTVTEYNFGSGDHIAVGLAQADALLGLGLSADIEGDRLRSARGRTGYGMPASGSPDGGAPASGGGSSSR